MLRCVALQSWSHRSGHCLVSVPAVSPPPTCPWWTPPRGRPRSAAWTPSCWRRCSDTAPDLVQTSPARWRVRFRFTTWVSLFLLFCFFFYWSQMCFQISGEKSELLFVKYLTPRLFSAVKHNSPGWWRKSDNTPSSSPSRRAARDEGEKAIKKTSARYEDFKY